MAKADIVLLAHTFDGDMDPSGWWCSEKLDGVRGYWTGTELLSRKGNRFHAPRWFTAGLPNVALDGELWIGRKRFDETSGVVRSGDWGELGKLIQFRCFDAPNVPGPFEARQKALQRIVDRARCRHLSAVEQLRVRDRAHLDRMLVEVEAKGGEGLIIREPGSLWRIGRSSGCLKVIREHTDEAIVVEHYKGAKGKPGVYCDWHGKRIKVANGFMLDGSNRPPVGAMITFKFRERTKAGMPRFPAFLRVRNDEPLGMTGT